MKKVPEVGDLVKINQAFKEEWWTKVSKTAIFDDHGHILEVKTVRRDNKEIRENV